MKGVRLTFPRFLLIHMHSATIITVWHTEAAVSSNAVTDSFLRISFGAGITNQIRLGVITAKNKINPFTSKPILYVFITLSSLRKFQTDVASAVYTPRLLKGGKLLSTSRPLFSVCNDKTIKLFYNCLREPPAAIYRSPIRRNKEGMRETVRNTGTPMTVTTAISPNATVSMENHKGS